MKKTLALFMVLALLFAFFAACDGNGGKEGTSPTAAQSEPAAAETQAPASAAVTDEGPYSLAAGKYDVDANGVPLGKYEYQLPLSTTDEVFTIWTVPVIPEEIPETGAQDMPYFAALAEKTGVNIEYNMVGWADRATNFSVLLAADDLCDITTNPESYYVAGPMLQAVEDGYFANLYDYKEYMPNYWYFANSHPEDINVKARIEPYPDTVIEFFCLYGESVTRNGPMVRGDWLDKLGMTVDEIVTLDDWHNMLLTFKSEIPGADNPFFLFNSLDPHQMFPAFDTNVACGYAVVAPTIVVDGKVEFCNSRPQDLEFLTMINQWWNDGLCEPDWMTADSTGTASIREQILGGKIGLIGGIFGEAIDFGGQNNTDPNAYFVALHKPVKEKGQVFHLGDNRTAFSLGAWALSGKCANLPLLISYADYFYSDGGVFFSNWGVEGYSFNYDENGKPQLTEKIYAHPNGMAVALIGLTLNEVCDVGMILPFRTYAYPGGEVLSTFSPTWQDPNFYTYDASMAWPTAIVLNAEDNSRISSLGADIKTYIRENYLQFVDNSKPLSEFDSYVAGLSGLGWEEARSIYQGAYDEFMAAYGG